VDEDQGCDQYYASGHVRSNGKAESRKHEGKLVSYGWQSTGENARKPAQSSFSGVDESKQGASR
jgi:hypothetical protein